MVEVEVSSQENDKMNLRGALKVEGFPPRMSIKPGECLRRTVRPENTRRLSRVSLHEGSHTGAEARFYATLHEYRTFLRDATQIFFNFWELNLIAKK